MYRLVCHNGKIPWVWDFEASNDRFAHLMVQGVLKETELPKTTTMAVLFEGTRKIATYTIASPTVCAHLHSNKIELPE